MPKPHSRCPLPSAIPSGCALVTEGGRRHASETLASAFSPVRSVLGVALLGVVPVFAVGSVGSAQSAPGPIFRIEPGLMSTDVVSVPAGVASATGFNVRFETRLPTIHRWLTPVIGASITPYGTSGIRNRSRNAPLLFVGNVFPFVSAQKTAGWATVDVPLLLYYSYGGGGVHNDRLYGRDLFLQIAARVHVGQKMLHDLGAFWSRVDAYAFLEQTMTPNRDSVSRRVDRFNPVVLIGLSMPFGATSSGR